MPQLNHYHQPIGDALPDWQAPAVLARSPLAGRYCHLEPLDADRHARMLFTAYQRAPDDRDWTWLTTGRPETLAAARDWAQEKIDDRDLVPYAVIDSQHNTAVGLVCFMRIDAPNGVMEIGHVTWSPAMKRSRLGTETIWLMLRHAFNSGYRRVEWKCDALNAASRRAAERLGFHFEGRFRQARVYKQRNRDTDWLSMLDSEWPVINAALSRWLAEENFDAEGRQHTPLCLG